MFAMTGIIDGITVSIKYEKGILSGDQAAIDKARYENTLDHGYLGVVPGGCERDYLSRELAARGLLRRHVFNTVISEENDDPSHHPGSVY